MDKTTISITKDLRDCMKMGAANKRVPLEEYLKELVMKDLGLTKTSA